MKKTIMLLFVIGIFFSCNRSTVNKPVIAQAAPVDSLIDNWNKSWNNHDSTAISNLFDAEVLVIDGQLIVKTPEELATKFIKPFYKMMSNIKTTKLQEWSCIDKAGYTGLWDAKVPSKNKKTMKESGVLTITWKRNDKAEWKITLANLHSFPVKKK
jgi:ketosteroid isomerase-like protein